MLENAGFGGGCHWCTEAVFQSLRGVTEVAQGFIAADPPHQAYSEAVSVTWDPDLIGFDVVVHGTKITNCIQHDTADQKGQPNDAPVLPTDLQWRINYIYLICWHNLLQRYSGKNPNSG